MNARTLLVTVLTGLALILRQSQVGNGHLVPLLFSCLAIAVSRPRCTTVRPSCTAECRHSGDDPTAQARALAGGTEQP